MEICILQIENFKVFQLYIYIYIQILMIIDKDYVVLYSVLFFIRRNFSISYFYKRVLDEKFNTCIFLL